MNEFKGTPGPWIANCFLVVAPGVPEGIYGGREICHTGQGRTTSAEAESNAKLIAAAPELLAACIQVRDYLNKMDLDWGGRGEDPLDAAIAKATL